MCAISSDIAVNVTFLHGKRGVAKIAACFARHQTPPPLFPRYAPGEEGSGDTAIPNGVLSAEKCVRQSDCSSHVLLSKSCDCHTTTFTMATRQ